MLPTLFAMLIVAALYWFPIRRWMNRWGATPADRARVMAGDGLLPDPTYSSTTAITVNASPEHIWPWLVQIGYRRGGLYSYDWLDCLFGYLDRPSATRILPEFQNLAVGDTIPMGQGPSWPVAVVEPRRTLVLDMRNMSSFDWVWQFGLYPDVVGVALADVARLALGHSHRQAGHRYRVAPATAFACSGVEEPRPRRPPTCTRRHPCSDSRNVRRESALGCATHTRGAAEAGRLRVWETPTRVQGL